MEKQRAEYFFIGGEIRLFLFLMIPAGVFVSPKSKGVVFIATMVLFFLANFFSGKRSKEEFSFGVFSGEITSCRFWVSKSILTQCQVIFREGILECVVWMPVEMVVQGVGQGDRSMVFVVFS